MKIHSSDVAMIILQVCRRNLLRNMMAEQVEERKRAKTFLVYLRTNSTIITALDCPDQCPEVTVERDGRVPPMSCICVCSRRTDGRGRLKRCVSTKLQSPPVQNGIDVQLSQTITNAVRFTVMSVISNGY